MLCKLIGLGDEGFRGFGGAPAVIVSFTGSFVRMLICGDGVLVGVGGSLVEVVLEEGGVSESSAISTGDVLLDPGLLEVECSGLGY